MAVACHELTVYSSHLSFKSKKKTASSQKSLLPRTIPIIMMNPQAVKKTAKSNNEKIGRYMWLHGICHEIRLESSILRLIVFLDE